jgi:hypothetical protein
MREIEHGIFFDCPLLKSIVLPASVSVIDPLAFFNSSIEEVFIDE